MRKTRYAIVRVIGDLNRRCAVYTAVFTARSDARGFEIYRKVSTGRQTEDALAEAAYSRTSLLSAIRYGVVSVV